MSNPFEKLLEKYFSRLIEKEKGKKQEGDSPNGDLLMVSSPKKSRKFSMPFHPVEKIRNFIELSKKVSDLETNYGIAVDLCNQLLKERNIQQSRINQNLEQLEDTIRMREYLILDIEQIENERFSLRTRVNEMEMSEKEIEVLKRGYQRLNEINRSLRTKNEFLEEEVESLKKDIKKNEALNSLLKRRQSRIDLYSAEKERIDHRKEIKSRLDRSRTVSLKKQRNRRRRKKKRKPSPKKKRIVAVKTQLKGRVKIRIKTPSKKRSGMNLCKYAIMKNLQKQGNVKFFSLMNDITYDLRELKLSLINLKAASTNQILEMSGEYKKLENSLPILKSSGNKIFLIGIENYSAIQNSILRSLGMLDNNNNNNAKKERNFIPQNRKMIFEGYVLWKDYPSIRNSLFYNDNDDDDDITKNNIIKKKKKKKKKNSKSFRVVFLVLSEEMYSLSWFESEEKEILIDRIGLEDLRIRKSSDEVFTIFDELGCIATIKSSNTDLWIQKFLLLRK